VAGRKVNYREGENLHWEREAVGFSSWVVGEFIHILDPLVANRIAAGEVVERPASVVKELVENSLDAGATHIRVDIERGGVRRICVTDNGCGMGREDAVLSLERHATSKLRESRDIDRIATLGFRGEALPSIASVSLFRCTTRREEDAEGTEIKVEGGEVASVECCGAPKGTQMEVRSLFSHVPARKKFLKTETTEWGHIEGFCLRCALAHPGVHFEWRHNRGVWKRFPPVEGLDERIIQVLGPEWDRETRWLEGNSVDGGWKVEGRISKPEFWRTSRREQFWFVNRRPVMHPGLGRALEEGYGARLASGRFARVVLFLEIPFEDVDVNVHPAKREVRFRNEAAIRRFLVESVDQALRSPAAGEDVSSGKPLSSVSHQGERVDPGEENRSSRVHIAVSNISGWREQMQWAPEPAGTASPLAPHDPRNHQLRVLSILAPGYLLAEHPDGVVLIHLSAAFERIYYEELLARFVREAVEAQRLLVPVNVEFAPQEAAFIEESSGLLEKAGLCLGSLGNGTFMVESLPAASSGENPERFVRRVVEALMHRLDAEQGRQLESEWVAAAVAKQMSRNRRVQGEEEIRWLLERLHACDLPYTRPDGRPTMTLVSRQEINRRFQVE